MKTMMRVMAMEGRKKEMSVLFSRSGAHRPVTEKVRASPAQVIARADAALRSYRHFLLLKRETQRMLSSCFDISHKKRLKGTSLWQIADVLETDILAESSTNRERQKSLFHCVDSKPMVKVQHCLCICRVRAGA